MTRDNFHLYSFYLLSHRYQVTFHLDFEFEHTLDVGSLGDHRVHVWWRSGYLSGRIKRFAQKFTDGRMDGQTDDGRRAIALSYWNELITNLGAFRPTKSAYFQFQILKSGCTAYIKRVVNCNLQCNYRLYWEAWSGDGGERIPTFSRWSE